MLENGLINEVKYFYDKNIKTKHLIGGIGYKELYNYGFDALLSILPGIMTLDDALSSGKENIENTVEDIVRLLNL